MPESFIDRVDRILRLRDSLVCVGLDPDPAMMPASLRRSGPRALRRFLSGIVRSTRPYASAYKCQLGSYLSFGTEGLAALAEIPKEVGPGRLRILDLKANDIPNSMRLLRDGAFRELGFDAVTVSPWLGWESLEPFYERPSKGIFLVAHSSNAGAADLQEIPTPRGPLWLALVEEARRLARAHGNVGVVVGATFPEALRQARRALGDHAPMLVPGIGAQGGRLTGTVREGTDSRGRGLLINASRSILFASRGSDWSEAAGREARRLHEEINQLRLGLRTAP